MRCGSMACRWGSDTGGIAGHLGGSKLSAMFTKSMPQRAWVDVVLNKHRSA